MLAKLRTRLKAVFSTIRPETKPLQGSVASHRSYILLNSPSPPTAFPSRFSTPLQRALQLHVTRWGGIVNFAWTGSEATSGSEASTSVTAFSALGGPIHFPSLSLANVDEVAEKLKLHATEPPPNPAHAAKVHLYVCTHGARDCRCGDMGGKVLQAIREDLAQRVVADPGGLASRVVLGEVGHVGGHQFAANLLVFPHGEWLGMLTPGDVPSVLDAILASERRPFTAVDPPLCRQFWRGRMGLPKDEQLTLHSKHS